MQRLFSTFPEGWPGAGLAFLRVAAAIPAIRQLLAGPVEVLPVVVTLKLAAAISALFLLIGLWTPVAGVVTAVAEVGLIFLYPVDPWRHVVLGTLGASLAMLGPGAWSVDARRFGRKRIHIPKQ
jgi:putative oxidoreductase